MAEQDDERQTQTTPGGLVIPVPTREQVMSDFLKVAMATPKKPKKAKP